MLLLRQSKKSLDRLSFFKIDDGVNIRMDNRGIRIVNTRIDNGDRIDNEGRIDNKGRIDNRDRIDNKGRIDNEGKY